MFERDVEATLAFSTSPATARSGFDQRHRPREQVPRSFAGHHGPPCPTSPEAIARFFSGGMKKVENVQIPILLVASILVIFGYFRLITDGKGHVNLNNYRFTGGIFLVVSGAIEGARDAWSLNMSPKAVSTLSICLGALLFCIGFSI